MAYLKPRAGCYCKLSNRGRALVFSKRKKLKLSKKAEKRTLEFESAKAPGDVVLGLLFIWFDKHLLRRTEFDKFAYIHKRCEI